MGQAADSILDLISGDHHQIGKLIDDNDDLRYCAIPSWLDGAGYSSFLSYVKSLFRVLGNIEVRSLEDAELQLVLMGKLITS